jgi:peptide/nickel transport system substrate-binding protein
MSHINSRKLFFCYTIAMILFGASTASAADNRLVYGESGRVDTYDPFTAHEAAAQRMADLLFDSLVDLGRNGDYVPRLASSWEISKAGTDVVFSLRGNVKWHLSAEKADSKEVGAPLTAKDVVATVRFLVGAQNAIPNGERFSVILGAEELDPLRVKVSLKRAVADPLRVLMFKILPSYAFAGLKTPQGFRDSAFPKKPVGTGPYWFVKANKQGEVLLRSNKNYHGGSPKIETIVMKSYADQSVMAQSLMFNALDLVTYVSPRDLGEVMADKRLLLMPYDALSYSFIAMNNARPVLSDRRVRQAIAMSVDRKEMLEAFFQGRGRLVTGPFPPTSWAYNLDVKPVSFDSVRARQLLQEAGYEDKNGDGFLENSRKEQLVLKMAVPAAGEGDTLKKIVLGLQSYMAKSGINIQIEFLDWIAWKKKVLHDHDYDLTVASWSFDDASNITSLFHSSSAGAWGNNFVQMKNRAVDALLTEADATNDFEKKRAIYHKIHAMLADETPYVFLWTLTHHAAFQESLEGVRIEPYSFFKHVSNWSLQRRL